MAMTLKFLITKERIRQSIVEGKPLERTQELNIKLEELDPHVRAMLSKYIESTETGFWLKRNNDFPQLPSETLDGLLKYVEELHEKDTEKLARDEAERQRNTKGREELLQWALEHGSHELQTRIDADQSWHSLAKKEYASTMLPPYFLPLEKFNSEGYVKDWRVNNAVPYQIQTINGYRETWPEIIFNLRRFRFELNGEVWHKTFIQAIVKTPSGGQKLYTEIDDLSELK
jgi:hypothetical protein